MAESGDLNSGAYIYSRTNSAFMLINTNVTLRQNLLLLYTESINNATKAHVRIIISTVGSLYKFQRIFRDQNYIKYNEDINLLCHYQILILGI